MGKRIKHKKSSYQIKKLSDVCEIKPPKKEVRDRLNANDLVSFVPMEDLGILTKYFIAKRQRRLEDVSGSYTYFANGDVLLAKITPCFENGKIGIARNLKNDIGFGSSEYIVLRSKRELISDYLYYFLIRDQFRKDGEKIMSGAVGHKRVPKEFIENQEIPLPPLPTQRRIVKKLDKIFEAIVKARENTERNLQNCRELFEGYLGNLFANLAEGWNKKRLGDIANVEYGFTDKAKDYGNFRFIRITDIDKDGCLISEAKKYIKSTKEAEKYILNDDDLLMARTGATFAKVLLYKNIEKSVFASYLIRIKFTEDILNELYWYFSKTKLYWDQANKLSSGSAQPQFNGAALKEVIFNYPKSMTKQKAIVKKFKALAWDVKKLQAIYQKKLADLEELKKSVLQKAFSA